MQEATQHEHEHKHDVAAERRPRRLAVAPMMERTDRHCRYFLRLLAPHAWLYTEMITCAALLRGDRRALLAFSPAEHPVALQLGGSEPRELAAAAALGAEAGYDEINLNVGCPSGRVQAGCFGAALMREPERVAACVDAMLNAVRVPVTVKTRLGVDEQDSYGFLCDFVGRIAEAGCGTVIVHARKAWLKGLSPKQNREVPPLDFARVRRLKRDFPALEILVNGGLTELGGALAELEHVDGVMLGRAAYADPYLLARLDAAIHGPEEPCTRLDALAAFVPYLEREVERGTPLKSMTRHLMGLFAGLPGGRRWRRLLGELPNDRASAETAIASLSAFARGLAAVERPAHAA
jgi:tRNA-dihydrouridine synthase A